MYAHTNIELSLKYCIIRDCYSCRGNYIPLASYRENNQTFLEPDFMSLPFCLGTDVTLKFLTPK